MSKRVLAIESYNAGHARIYGEGEYIGDYIPNAEPFRSIKLSSPCIRLDNGKLVWGFQCWWGNAEGLLQKFRITTKEVVELSDDQQVGFFEPPTSTNQKVDLLGDQLFIDDKFAARIEHSDALDSHGYLYFHFYVNENTGMYIIGIPRDTVECAEEAQQAAIKRLVGNPKIYKYG